MCGIAGIFGNGPKRAALGAMVASQRHRGPDAEGMFECPTGLAALGHNRLSIIDLSSAGTQPMSSPDGRFTVAFNGEIYNYLELRAELADYPYRTRTDTEVILAAYQRWGPQCLDHFIGMFAFLLWDSQERLLFAARDRFGVKPLYYHVGRDGCLLVASEIKALHAAGVEAQPDPVAWATYLTYGFHDHSERTFWQDIRSLPAGHTLTWKNGRLAVSRWYDLAERTGLETDTRPTQDVEREYLELLQDSVRLRFRSDVPVAINLSGGLDSSALLATVQLVQGADSEVTAFTFVTDDPLYDELPWVRQMLAGTRHPLVVCHLSAIEVPDLAASVQAFADEPFGGLPTLAYARVFERARAEGIVVLLDGQGMDEQWAGYDYYRGTATDEAMQIQGTTHTPMRPEGLTPAFRALAEPLEVLQPFPDRLRNLQYRDTHSKIPRALRFSDRVSMRSSTELRVPFFDHRLFELAFRQPADRKVSAHTGKVLLRHMLKRVLPTGIVEAPKRPVQTPQREWLRGPLWSWAADTIDYTLTRFGGDWLDERAVRTSLHEYATGHADSSFHLWQWISLGMIAPRIGTPSPRVAPAPTLTGAP